MFEELADSQNTIVGVKQVSKALKAGQLKRLYLASDADAELKTKVSETAKAANVPIVNVPAKKKLGELCGISVAAACAGVKKPQ